MPILSVHILHLIGKNIKPIVELFELSKFELYSPAIAMLEEPVSIKNSSCKTRKVSTAVRLKNHKKMKEKLILNVVILFVILLPPIGRWKSTSHGLNLRKLVLGMWKTLFSVLRKLADSNNTKAMRPVIASPRSNIYKSIKDKLFTLSRLKADMFFVNL